MRTTSSSLVSAEELAGSSGDNQSVDTGYISYSTRSLYVIHMCFVAVMIFACRTLTLLVWHHECSWTIKNGFIASKSIQ